MGVLCYTGNLLKKLSSISDRVTTRADHRDLCASGKDCSTFHSPYSEKLFYKRELIWPEGSKTAPITAKSEQTQSFCSSFLFFILLLPPFLLGGGGGVAPTCVYNREGQRYLPQLTCPGPARVQVVGLVSGLLCLQVSSRASVSGLHFAALGSVKQSRQKAAILDVRLGWLLLCTLE